MNKRAETLGGDPWVPKKQRVVMIKIEKNYNKTFSLSNPQQIPLSSKHQKMLT